MAVRNGCALALVAGGALLTACCINPVEPPLPSGPCGFGPCADAGFFSRDAGATFVPVACERPGFGTACERECASPLLTCFRERRTTTDVDTGEGAATLEIVAFPDGTCSAQCAADEDCGSCGRCVDHTLAGRARLRGLLGGTGVCRPACFGAGDCRPGYACDLERGACVEACTDDAQCRFSSVDTDGDGVDDALAYDAETDQRCAAGICTSGAPAIGETCREDSQCGPGFTCLRHRDGGGVGVCSRLGCADDASCGAGAACVGASVSWRRSCTAACVVGADEPPRRLGAEGSGAGCPVGFACVHHGPGATDGACMPAGYNDRTETNVGAACLRDTECFSPYGRGRCHRRFELGADGVCVVDDCVPGGGALWPGVSIDEPPALCDESTATCLEPEGGRSLCARACGAANDCLPGWACVALDGSSRLCMPICGADGDCRAGASCRARDGSPCDGADRGCTCG